SDRPTRQCPFLRTPLAALLVCLAEVGCSAVVAQPPCQTDHNCLPGQVCDTATHTCVPRAASDSGPGVDGGQADAASPDRGLDGGAADRALPDTVASDQRAPDLSAADSVAGDQSTTDVAQVDSSSTDGVVADRLLPDVAAGDGSAPDAASTCVDPDGDGYGPGCSLGSDCDDTLPTCNVDCTTNSDSDTPAVPDCVERFCGSDPLVSGSVCRIVATRTELSSAIGSINDNEDGVPDHLLLEEMALTTSSSSSFVTITSDDGLTVRQRPGAILSFNSSESDLVVFEVNGDQVTFEGIHFVEVRNVRSWVRFRAVSGTLRHCILDGYEESGVSVDGATGTLIQDNIIINGDGSDSDGEAAIAVGPRLLASPRNTIIVGNVLAHDEAGIHVQWASGLRIDHNTIADVTYDAVRFHDTDSSGVCMRNNAVVRSGAAAINFDHSAGWDVSASCAGPLDTGGDSLPDYGNDAHGNTSLCSGDCNGTTESSCESCLPGGSGDFWEFLVDPRFATTTYGHAGFYCPAATALINAADILATSDPIYDRNGPQAGDYNGSAPDIGGRETGSLACTAPGN
ncbi:MAG: right-handed parallel beta-helix repeat-containing protein, partial [Deltaproteobacteria bacterium]|nr:right-handed parallel beta-helix repeat-containing protein [Deltaproteobacteria bacterium]